jgi:flagellar hook-associated protein 3 FlgL
MRITNKMMTNNMMNNINKNKLNMTSLEQQYSSGKKIQKPSDDPIITVRALKLRTNLSEIEQYHEKNIPDAMSWMDVTESALDTVNELLRQINTYCVQGSTDTLSSSDRDAIVQNLKQMKQQIYQEGNTNYAGRYVFTGFKTDSSLIFTEGTSNLNYSITENIAGNQIQVSNKVDGGYNLEDYDDPAQDFSEAPNLLNTYRIQLAYDKLDEINLTGIQYSKKDADGNPGDPETFANIQTVSVTSPDAYKVGRDEAHFIYETGEIILGEDAYEMLRTADNMQITYSKSEFVEGDLKPEHYFNCTVKDTDKPEKADITYKKEKQSIDYEINYNQKLTVNTEASDSITHKIGRDIDDILKSVDEVIQTEKVIEEVKNRLKDNNLTETQKQKYEKMLEQLDTELELKKDLMQGAFDNGIKSSNLEQDKVNTAMADLGSRYVRLELTEDRLASQKVDFEDLLSKNEDADLVDTVIKYNSAETIYNASLTAASKVIQNTLLNFL